MEIRLSLDVPRRPSAAEVARHAVDAFKTLVTPPALDDVKLVVTELVSNSIRHGQGGDVRIHLALGADGALRGEVVDRGEGFAQPTAPPAPDASHGRGLPIVDALVDRWGVRTGSTHVWFEMGSAGTGPAD